MKLLIDKNFTKCLEANVCLYSIEASKPLKILLESENHDVTNALISKLLPTNDEKSIYTLFAIARDDKTPRETSAMIAENLLAPDKMRVTCRILSGYNITNLLNKTKDETKHRVLDEYLLATPSRINTETLQSIAHSNRTPRETSAMIAENLLAADRIENTCIFLGESAGYLLKYSSTTDTRLRLIDHLLSINNQESLNALTGIVAREIATQDEAQRIAEGLFSEARVKDTCDIVISGILAKSTQETETGEIDYDIKDGYEFSSFFPHSSTSTRNRVLDYLLSKTDKESLSILSTISGDKYPIGSSKEEGAQALDRAQQKIALITDEDERTKKLGDLVTKAKHLRWELPVTNKASERTSPTTISAALTFKSIPSLYGK